MASFGLHVTKREWDRMAMKHTHDIIKDLKSSLPPDHPTCGERTMYFFDNFVKSTLGLGKHWRSEADFKVVELLFKTKFYLDRTFDYNKYLSFVLEDVVVNLSTLVRTPTLHPRQTFRLFHPAGNCHCTRADLVMLIVSASLTCVFCSGGLVGSGRVSLRTTGLW